MVQNLNMVVSRQSEKGDEGGVGVSRRRGRFEEKENNN